ncbi:DUF3870 domain-containing protein [Alteribacter natronophilus]|nr:DUF3870 domain-containing protein [Alteribacter natronophilus]
MDENLVLSAGFAQFPKGTSLFETQRGLTCVLIIDPETDVIKDASFTFLMDVTNCFIVSLVKGKNVTDGIEEIVEVIEKRFIVPGQRAVIQAVYAAYERYWEAKTGEKPKKLV